MKKKSQIEERTDSSRKKTQGFRDVSTLVESLLQRDYEYELDYGVYEDVR